MPTSKPNETTRESFVRVDVDGIDDTMTVRAPGKVRLGMGDTVYLSPELENLHRFDKSGDRIT